ncbi:sodium/proton antiporter, CPA1 family (TC 2.A.36) [Pseudoduganella flava]|uniref:Sodium/proton antiporter, CPA1 family (TC 2.A.36) n=1 Tax=Pseudoduganella flava TaxID=871742 RepID=A0A562PMZ9_9BURK|nr:cation:proton antiporter [Pseudoduganella flava]QGZ40890.1 sodium:proton antiporter [Pseudoduganella flava]TWI45436.1 sodium/proton antiporter, CPA1 family (TC 2.A.36) [Pseudoduganella flava]
MATYQWFLLIGCLMLARGLWGTPIAHLPFTSAMIYLGVGLVLGPMGLRIFSFDLYEAAPLLELLTEVAVLISLFSAGIKMPVPFLLARWMAPIRLAWFAMAISILLIALFAHYLLGMPLGAGVLLGAILAPTDPVLASDVQLRHAGDKDPLRFALSCEAGMNDGSAFPFVMLGLGLLGLHDLGDNGLRWFTVELLWGTVGGVAIGVACGAGLARLSHELRLHRPKHEVLDDLMGLGLIAVAYGLAVAASAWGFLAVFAAGVALRQTELKLAARSGRTVVTDQGVLPAQDTISANSLLFKEHLERLSELTLVLLLGGATVFWLDDWRGWITALFLFFIARPASVLIALGGGGSPRAQAIIAWFGVRGIGSLYYLMYAINHGLPTELARDLISITTAVIMLSIVIHGTSVTPLLDRFWRT